VRNLERELAKLARKAVKEILTLGEEGRSRSRGQPRRLLGVPRYRFGEAEF
jgi:ATP-dependent Lon protease